MAIAERFNEDWTVEVVGKMHKYRITGGMLAEECNYRPEYISMLLNGKKEFKTERGREKARDVVYAGLDRLIQRIDDEYLNARDEEDEYI